MLMNQQISGAYYKKTHHAEQTKLLFQVNEVSFKMKINLIELVFIRQFVNL
jgi:hypothetical protein